MPELPDVEYLRQYAQATSLHKEIESVDLADNRLLESVAAATLAGTLEGDSFARATRHGKHLFLTLSSRRALMLHFGMTGSLSAYKGRDDPEYAYLTVRFADGYSLSYRAKRMLGAIDLAESAQAYLHENDIGPDALEISGDQLEEILAGGRGAVKSTLMNQSRIAGLGNIYTDEVLFQARIDPRRECDDISDEEMRRIHREISRVCDSAVQAHARPECMPESFLITHRSPDGHCPRCGGTITKITLSGRSTYLCERCQR